MPDPIELTPGWSSEIDVGAEPHAVPGRSGLGFQFGQARQVQQAHHRPALVAEDVAGDVVELWDATRLAAQICGQEGRHARPPGRLEHVLGRGGVWRHDRQHAVVRVERRAQGGGAGVFHQAHEMEFRQPGRVRRVERRVALREGEGAVPWQGAAWFHLGLLDRLGGQALHGITV